MSTPWVLGVSAFYHDSAACLVRGGEIIAAASEERFTRTKGDAGFPRQAVAYCLRQAGIATDDLASVVFYDKPLLKFERIIETYLSLAPRGLSQFLRSGPAWVAEKLYTARACRDALEYSGPLLFTEHHEAHAASAFFPSPFERAAILTIDGVGEWASSSIGVGQRGDIALHRELHWPNSLGLLYSAFTEYLGFRVNSGEYKVMGLAPYGQPAFARLIYDELIDLHADGSFTMNQAYFDYLGGMRMTNARFARLFGAPRRAPESQPRQRDMDIARSIQDVCEEIVLRMARTAHAETGERNLCMAGGVALNCVANGRILREGPFERLWVQPAAGDAGGALGAALLAAHRHHGVARTSVAMPDGMKGALLGPAFTDEEIAAALTAAGAISTRLDRETLLARTAKLLASGQVVGWFSGRMEFGPRALGARSILGDPRDATMQSRLNLKIKFRESFRPFAPSVRRERVADYFELDADSPYMLLTALARAGIPAVTHVDGSARVQTVTRDVSPEYYDLLSAFDTLTGCPVLVNTSFNVRGEPIVCSPTDAIRCFMATDMDALVIGSYLVEKSVQTIPTGRDSREAGARHATEAPSKSTTEILRDARRFGFLIGGVFLLVAAFAESPVVRVSALAVATILMACGASSPRTLIPVRSAWMTGARLISRVTTPVIMTIVYVVVLTPMALVARAVGHRPFGPRAAGTRWVIRDRPGSDLTRQF
jgi:carbamoyltransferase